MPKMSKDKPPVGESPKVHVSRGSAGSDDHVMADASDHPAVNGENFCALLALSSYVIRSQCHIA